MSPAVRYVAFAGLLAFAGIVTFLVWGCRSRWGWFQGCFIDEDGAAGDPDDDIWETAGTQPDTIAQLLTRVNARRAAHKRPPLNRDQLDDMLHKLQLEIDRVNDTGWRP